MGSTDAVIEESSETKSGTDKPANVSSPESAKRRSKAEAKVAEPAAKYESGVGFLSAAVVIVFNLLCILTLCFMYSFSAFKLDLKKHMHWDENQLSSVFMLATVGQNFVVHLGLFCDKYGSPLAFLLAAALKAVGLFGMYWCSAHNMGSPWVFGAFFFLDTQGMSGGLIMAMKEVQRASPARFSGLMASLSKASFGMGAVYMTSLYDYLFRPDVSLHFLSAAIQGVVTLLICAISVPLLVPKPKVSVDSKRDSDKAAEEPVMPIILSEAYFACFLGMLVCWGGGMVWNANMASFSTAAGFSLSTQKVIRSYFYTAKTALSLCIGPLTDLGGREMWYALTTVLMFASGVVMYISDGKWMFVGATMAGGAFGSIATLIPIMSKKLSFKNMGTLYSVAKFAGMISGISWNYYAGAVAQSLTKPGESNCFGDECYRKGWALVLSTQAPLVAYLLFWATKCSMTFPAKKKVE